MDNKHILMMVAVMAAATAALRAFPFVVFGGGRKPPKIVFYLGRVVSPAAIAMLAVYCYKDVVFTEIRSVLPPVLAGIVVVLLHVWKKNPLISILAGTTVYMILLQKII